jgi:hypothetical protein
MGKAADALEGFDDLLLLCLALVGVGDVLPLAAATFIGDDTAGADAVGRGLQQFLQFAAGVLALAADDAGEDAIAWYSIGDEYSQPLAMSNAIPAAAEIGNF